MKGRKTGERRKGTPNKVTAEARAICAAILDDPRSRQGDLMRKLICGLVFVMAIVAMGPVLNAQEPAPFLAVRDCQINPGEGAAFREAQRALLDYVVANPIEAPGSVAGTFRGALNNFSLSRFVWQGENLGEWEEWNRLNFQARRDDPLRQAIYRERNSHLNSCNWQFIRRIVN